MATQDFTKGAKKLSRNNYQPLYDWQYKDGDRPAPAIPERKIFVDFSSGTIAPLTIWGSDSLIVTSLNPPPGGGNSMMGNLAGGAGYGVDPLTNKSRDGSPANFDIRFLTAGTNRTWDGVFLQYWMRFDDADNNGTLDINGVPTKVVSAPKLGYVSCTKDVTETGCAIYQTLAPTEGIRGYAPNKYTEAFIPSPALNGNTFSTSCPALNFQYDGQWRLVQIYVDHQAHTIATWINGIKAVGNAMPSGDLPLHELFTFDHFRFFHGNPNVWDQSANRTGEKGRFQIANIEVWNGNPKGVVDGYV